MSVTVTDPVAGPFTPNSVTVAFPFNFKIATAAEIAVFHDGIEVDPADYTVTLAVDEEGGTVTFDVAPATSSGPIYLVSDPLFTQTADFNAEGPFSPRSLNGFLDRSAIRDIAMREELSRTIRVPVGNDGLVLDGTAGVIGVDADGNAVFHETGEFIGEQGPPGDLSTIASVALLEAVTAPVAGNARFLLSGWRGGLFEFDDSNLTVEVAADPLQGVYVAPSSDATGASGAWVRYVEGKYSPLWFGFSEAATGANNVAAFQALLDMLEILGIDSVGVGTPYRGNAGIYIRPGIYPMSGAVDERVTVHVEGANNAALGTPATVLQWDNTSSGFRVQRINTSGDTTYDVVSHGGGDGCSFSNICLDGGFPAGQYTAAQLAGEAERHAIHFKARISATGCLFRNWAGDALHSNAVAGAAGPTEGNANLWRVIDCQASNCRKGLATDGADTNAGYSNGFNASSCRWRGIDESSFLDNEHRNFHLDSNGFTELSMATSGGNVYYVIVGQEVWCDTNAPTGAATSNQGWGYHAPGGVGAYGARAWSSGLGGWRAGGPIFTDSATAQHVASGYIETGQAPAMLTEPTMWLGRFLGAAKRYGTNTDWGSYLLAITLGLKAAGKLQVVGSLDAQGGIALSGGIWPTHQLLRDPTHGLTMYGVAGATNDFLLGTPGGAQILRNPTGTLNLEALGNFGIAAGKAFKVAGLPVVGAQGAAVADPAAITSANAVNAAAAPTQAEFNAFVAEFNKLRTDFTSERTANVALLARLRAATGHGLIA